MTKEIRALLPAWIASACAISAAVLGGPRSHDLGLIAYGFGSVGLGAQSVGHEYTHWTLSLLLSQPASRRRLLLLKLGVLTGMLLTLTLFAWLTLLRPGELQWVAASLLNALFLAPLLTLVCRNPLAGVVFTGAAPFWLSVLGPFVSAGLLWGGTLAVSIAAAVAGWRRFMRLEAIDGRDPDVRLPLPWRRRTTAIVDGSADSARARHPAWLVVKKEIHLQQMTFAVAGVWLVIWVVESALTRIVPGFVGLPLPLVSILFGALLALLVGSLASAEERQIGTLEWQVLLPMAAWQQWTVKVGTALGLSALLSFAVPIVLAGGHVGVSGWHVAAIFLLTTGSLYVSSLCRSGLRALIVSGPVMLAFSMLVLRVAAFHLARIALPLAGVVALMLWFAFENHRSAGQSAGRVSRQVMWIAGCLALGAGVVTAWP